MSEKKSKFSCPTVISCIAAVLMIVLLVLQFTPFWTYNKPEEPVEKISISTYIWFPTEHKDVAKYFSGLLTEEAGEKVKFDVNSMVLPPILVLLAGFVGSFLCLLMSSSLGASLLTILCGAAGTWGYLGIRVLQYGAGWQLHLGLSIVILLVGIVMAVMQIKQIRQARAAAL